MLALNDGAQENLDTAITHDADFALPHIALARWFQYAGNMAQAQASKRGHSSAWTA
jgi:Tfp pilus assembly protein PilF